MVQNFVSAKLRNGLSWKTVKHLRTLLGTILGAAGTWGLIERNPVRLTRFPRHPHPRQERAPIAPERIQQLLEALPEPSRSIACLLAWTGLRIGELLALRWRDVDLEQRVLHVRQTVYEGHFDEPKSRSSQRTVPFGPKAIALIAARRPEKIAPDALVFSTRQGTAVPADARKAVEG
jgi:integrase